MCHDELVRTVSDTIELSASDLSQFLGCHHRTALDLQVAVGHRAAPSWADPVLAILQERGLDHERRYADALRSQGLRISDLAEVEREDAVSQSLEGMQAGFDVLLQPALHTSRWFGKPDILRRVETPSNFGPWSYEVWDTKLAKETRGGTILQLALYSALLQNVQGTLPESFHVVTPDPANPVQSFRVLDFAAYFRLIRAHLDETSFKDPVALVAANYPEPVEHCEVCRWRMACDLRRHDDDHLSLVAGISRLQTRELQAAGVNTLAQLGSLTLPLPFQPRRGAIETYVRVREQARVQLDGRTRNAPVHELLPLDGFDHGLARLPAPAAGDIFLDLEGDPFARDGGREYLFGLASGDPSAPTYRAHWAHSDSDERWAFEATIDLILQSWASDPVMHVYHYAPYEPAAFKRLMGRHATREADVDRMLRAGVFVDLHAVVRQALLASVEDYSIKKLEPFYAFTRTVKLEDARTNLRLVERALELADTEAITADVRSAVEGYNRDDCISAWRLRDWLEQLRGEVEAQGTPIPRPKAEDGAPSEKIGERERRVQELRAKLIADVPGDAKQRSDEQHARWILAYLLDWHRREDKAPWWEFHRLRDLPGDELLDERAAIAGLQHLSRPGGTKKCPIDRYSFPPQETDVGEDDELHLPDPDGTTLGTVASIDLSGHTVDIKKRGDQANVHPTAVFAHSVINSDALAESVLRIGQDVVDHGMTAATRYRAARDLLLRLPPRLRSGVFEIQAGESAVEFATRIATQLDHTVLPIQGPPGSGKTYTGARMICELVRRGLRVGVTAVSHKVISHLLKGVQDAGAKSGQGPVACLAKVSDKSKTPPPVEEVEDNNEALERLRNGRAQVVGATAWFWARPEAFEAVDVLFVDEAGQMSLANVIAASQGAKSLVLLGDPRQLEQPQQGTHPEGTDVSALEHVLRDHRMMHEHQTMPADRGIFLPETRRLAPAICQFTSELFYEGRLHPLPGLERQVLTEAAPFDGAGLWLMRVPHEGNQNSSREEAEVVQRIVSKLLAGAQWVDSHGALKPITPDDILVVAPYNAHIALLEARLGPQFRVGTVDRFQGQEAPVVIYSMATSTPQDAPRGMEFLYSLNRLNVATSRAQCACILVASSRLFEPECKTPRQMQLANALCRYAELARAVTLSSRDLLCDED